jgi:plasmid stabilization system protein ParE
MKYRVTMTRIAEAEMELAHAWIEERSPINAARWKQRSLKSIDSLELFPARCGLAPEADLLDREIRQLLFGKRRGIYRILFEIRDDEVVGLHIRHGAMRFLGEE